MIDAPTVLWPGRDVIFSLFETPQHNKEDPWWYLMKQRRRGDRNLDLSLTTRTRLPGRRDGIND